MAVNTGSYRTILLTYLRPQWPSVIALALLLGSSIALDLLGPQLLRLFIDTAVAGGALQVLLTTAGIYIAVSFAGQLVMVAATFAGERVGWRATNQLRVDLALHCLRQDMPFHKAHPPGVLIERIDADVSAMATLFARFVFQVLGSGLLLIGALLLIWREDWRAGLALSLFAALAGGLLWSLRAFNVHNELAASAAAAELAGFLEERLAGLEELRANGAGEHTVQHFAQLQRRLAHAERRANTVGPQIWVISTALFVLGGALSLAIGALLYSRGAASIGTVFLFFQYTEMLRGPLERIAREVQSLQEASAGFRRINELFKQRSVRPDGRGPPLPDGVLDLRFEHVSFGYDAERPAELALHDVSFSLAAGERLGLLGHTGSGKTSISRLLLRLYDPWQGQVCLGGRPLSDLSQTELYRYIGIVTQDVHLFRASLRDNLTLFDPRHDDRQLLDVIAALGLHDWYRGLMGGLDTAIEPAGLSAGEAQLVALARVFLQNPGLVILDEASSRLDVATEQLVERAMERLLSGRSAIVIAHRLETVLRSDSIVILEQGRVVEQGKRVALQADPQSRLTQLLRVGLERVLQ